MKTLKPRELMSLFQSLQTLLTAGLALVPALELQARERVRLSRELTQITLSLREGQTFTAAFSRCFTLPAHLLNTLRLGEHTGELAQACGLCVQSLHNQLTWRSMIWSLCFYPFLLFITSLGLCWVMMGFVLPEFASLYQTLSLPLPESTGWLLDLAQWGPDYFARTICVGLMIVLFLSLLWKLPEGRFKVEQLLIFLPFYRSHYQYLLSQQLGLLLQAGTSLLNALELVRAGTSSPSFASYLLQTQQNIQRGLSLNNSFAQGRFADERLQTLLAHAQETGQLDKVFLSLASQHKERLAGWQEKGKHLLQPIITLILGGFLGFWILLLYYPMLQLGTNLG